MIKSVDCNSKIIVDNNNEDDILDLSVKPRKQIDEIVNSENRNLNMNKRKKPPTKSSFLLKCIDEQEDKNLKTDDNDAVEPEQDDLEQPINQDEQIIDDEEENIVINDKFSSNNDNNDEEEFVQDESINNEELQQSYYDDFDNQSTNITDDNIEDNYSLNKKIKLADSNGNARFNVNRNNEIKRVEALVVSVPSAASTSSYTSPRNVRQSKTKPTSPAPTALTPTPPMSNSNSNSTSTASKKQMRFQCRFCVYKSHSVSLMQNHIYRHIDTTPYSCFYCGHKSTTKSTIMVHIELCHPNMEVKIKESRVKEEDYYLDLNSSSNSNGSSSAGNDLNNFKENKLLHSSNNSNNKFEIIPNKCHLTNNTNNLNTNNKNSPIKRKQVFDVDCSMNQETTNSSSITPVSSTSDIVNNSNQELSSVLLNSLVSSSSSSSSSSVSTPMSSASSLCSSPSASPVPQSCTNKTVKSDDTPDNFLQIQLNSAQNKSNQSVDEEDANSYVTVFNRPKQYFGSLYEPDKQYSCKLCTYTTNHKPSMEDHVYVHTNKRPYRCGYCNEEIYTRYAATYHNKYKHPGEPRNFIKDEQDVSIYYVNRAKKSSTSSVSTPMNGVSFEEEHTHDVNNNKNSVVNNNDVKKPNPSSPSPPLSQTNKHKKQKTKNSVEQSSISPQTGSNSSSTNSSISYQPFQMDQNTSNTTSTSPSPSQSNSNTANSNISAATAAAITQLMLSNAAAALATNNNQSNNTSTVSPTASNPSTSPNNPSQIYDFNLALKMYQIQLQSLMAANYFQSLRPNSNQAQPPQQQTSLLASYFGINQDPLLMNKILNMGLVNGMPNNGVDDQDNQTNTAENEQDSTKNQETNHDDELEENNTSSMVQNKSSHKLNSTSRMNGNNKLIKSTKK